MRHMKPVQIPALPARDVMELDRVTCDFCGETIAPDVYDAEEVTVSHRTGSRYPEGGSGEMISVDMCGACFDSKLLPWIEECGVVATRAEWDW